MKKILISQRRDSVAGRNEQRDALDVKWGELLQRLGYFPIPIVSSMTEYDEFLADLDDVAILLSGGNDIGEIKERDLIEEKLLCFAAEKKIPVLGVCRGMQMINRFLGGDLERVANHVVTEHQIYGEITNKYAYTRVNSYHDFAIDSKSISPLLKVIAKSSDGIVEAIRHRSLPWFGIMWHPERCHPFNNQDIELIKNIFETGDI